MGSNSREIARHWLFVYIYIYIYGQFRLNKPEIFGTDICCLVSVLSQLFQSPCQIIHTGEVACQCNCCLSIHNLSLLFCVEQHFRHSNCKSFLKKLSLQYLQHTQRALNLSFVLHKVLWYSWKGWHLVLQIKILDVQIVVLGCVSLPLNNLLGSWW